MQTVEQIRERDAKRLSEWMDGAGAHPQGKSGERFLLPRTLTSDTRDAVDWRFSEWGNAAGLTPD